MNVMIDIADINEPLVKNFVTKLDIAPGTFRDGNRDAYNGLVENVHESYDGIRSTRDAAKGYNNLAFQLRRLGYGDETIIFAERSNELDPENALQVAANLGFIAYAVGMINGDYEDGLRRIVHHNQHCDRHRLFDQNPTFMIKSDQNAGQIYHRKGMLKHEFYDLAIGNYASAEKALYAAKNISVEEYTQFQAQIDYCLAKTFTHMARLDGASNGTLISEAEIRIKRAIQTVGRKTNFPAFDKACFLNVYAGVCAIKGEKDAAIGSYTAAISQMVEHGPTVISRIGAAEVKLAQLTRWLPNEVPPAMKAFFGKRSHPDMGYYQTLGLTLESGVPARFVP